MTVAVRTVPEVQIGLQRSTIKLAFQLKPNAISNFLRKLFAPFAFSGLLWVVWLFDIVGTKGKMSRVCFDAEKEALIFHNKLRAETKEKLLDKSKDCEEALRVVEEIRNKRNFFERLVIWDCQINHFARTVIHLGETIEVLRSLEESDQEEMEELKGEISSLIEEIDFKSIDYSQTS